jgi:hypothetical protein
MKVENERQIKLVTKTMNETTEGKLTVWRTDGPLDDMIFELSANLTADGERLIVVDATGYFDPSRVSLAAASVARGLHVLRTSPGAELQAALWMDLRSAQQRTQARRILLVGVLDHLYDRGILTRDAARALGQIKRIFEALTRSGLDVTVVCGEERAEGGARSYLVSSLCASAQEIRQWRPLTPEEYIDGASAAIA